MRSFWAKLGKSLLRRWAPVLIVILCGLAALTALEMRRVGSSTALTLLPRLLTYVGLVALVILVRYVVVRWVAGLFSKGTEGLRRQITQQVIAEGKGRASGILDRGVSRAKGALQGSGGGKDQGWSGATTGWRSTPTPLKAPEETSAASAQPVQCRKCGRPLRPGAQFCDTCGASVQPSCPKCGRELRAQADFCDGCGRRIRPRDRRA